MAHSFLSYGSGRWLWISLASGLGLVLHYSYYRMKGVAYGGSVEGLLYGVVGTTLIAILMYLGIRRRSYSSHAGTLQGWLSAHVYLGLLTLVVIPLHAGFRFGWDVHTLAFALLVVVVLSGVGGVLLYRVIPGRLTRFEARQQPDKIDPQLARLLSDMRALVKDKSNELVEIYRAELAVSQNRIPSGWALLRGQTRDLLAERSSELAAKAAAVPMEEQATFQVLSQLVLKKAQLELNLLQQMQLRNALKAWLYVHVPVSIAMVCAVVIHLIVVFWY
ncbi:MAG: hypothetical protein CV089_01750 [Nitrospira sp. WS110]|nr:hypothetical protein [Nitrospira sp. WS110]